MSHAIRRPNVELLWWEGCPSTEAALAELRAALHDCGLDGVEVRMTEMRTDADARQAKFVGSPTIRIDGRDVQPLEAGEPHGLTCRVYRRSDGRVSPTPGPATLRAALASTTGGK